MHRLHAKEFHSLASILSFLYKMLSENCIFLYFHATFVTSHVKVYDDFIKSMISCSFKLSKFSQLHKPIIRHLCDGPSLCSLSPGHRALYRTEKCSYLLYVYYDSDWLFMLVMLPMTAIKGYSLLTNTMTHSTIKAWR